MDSKKLRFKIDHIIEYLNTIKDQLGNDKIKVSKVDHAKLWPMRETNTCPVDWYGNGKEDYEEDN